MSDTVLNGGDSVLNKTIKFLPQGNHILPRFCVCVFMCMCSIIYVHK